MTCSIKAATKFTHQLNFESAGERFDVELVTFRHLLIRKNQNHLLLPPNTVHQKVNKNLTNPDLFFWHKNLLALLLKIHYLVFFRY